MYKNLVLTGSVAYDFVFNIKDPFSKYIQPDKIHQINISIVADSHAKSFGGTAGNHAFYLSRLGVNSILCSSVGYDFSEYNKFLSNNKIITKFLKYYRKLPTASGFVMTDIHDNQIWMYSKGAMQKNIKLKLKPVIDKLQDPMVVISPNELGAIKNYVNECIKNKFDFSYDPAFFIPHLDKESLILGIRNSKLIFGNDYEIAFIEKKLGSTIEKLIKKNQIVVKTLGEHGSEIFYNHKWIKIGIFKANTVDPTGAGDAYRAGFLFGYIQGNPLAMCGWMGAVTASFAVETRGTMNLKFNKKEFKGRLSKLI